ncbi:MAG: ATP-dependent carboxylate-amine ligase, partial [Chlamydiia bacterium]|nr:ATP-dependent carboxylate-amine ligase [Chlamydiia bacterium]
MLQKITALVTGAGAPGIAGTIFSLKALERPLRLIGVDLNAEAAGGPLLDKLCTVPPPESEEYHTTLLEICRREEVQVILPQTTREIEALSKEISFYREAGVEVMVSPWEAIRAANDKAHLIQLFKSLGFSAPKTVTVHTVEELMDAALTLGYPQKPVAVKPPKSNGMRGYRTLTTQRMTLERFLA